MDHLSGIMVGLPDLLEARFREPAVTAWNRIEARPRGDDFTRSLRAEVRDPLWMLTRQWQLGELDAEDAGSPIDARLLTRRLTIDRVQLGDRAPGPYDDTMPMEAAIERERVPFTHALRVQAAQYFLRLHPDTLRTKYVPRYRSTFAFAQNADAAFRGQVDGLNLYVATRRFSFDGGRALDAIRAGTFMDSVPIDAADRPALQPVLDAFATWLQRQYIQPVGGDGSTWDTERLCYAAAAAAPSAGTAQVHIAAPHYTGGRLDWHSFDVVPDAPPMAIDDAAHTPAVPSADALSFLPVAASFQGMPSPRFWEMEERQVNFGALDALTTDHLLLVLAELGLVYGNDWFVVPYALPVNTLCEVLSLVVTDVFGDRTLVRAASTGAGDWQRWSAFTLASATAGASAGPGSGGDSRHFFLPATVAAVLEGDPLERVHFVRDEMANMMWAVEEIIPDATGRGIDGHQAADRAGVLAEPIADSTAPVRYLLGTTVPENWIPFIPVQRPGSVQDIAFQRAALPHLGVPPRDVILPKGALLNEPALPWFINEEEVPFAGTIVTRSFQRARWYDGRTCLWIGRLRETGRGVGNSNLRFDQVEPLTAAEPGGG